MSEEPKHTGDYTEGGFVTGGPLEFIGDNYCLPLPSLYPTAAFREKLETSVETIEAKLVEQNALLAEVRDHLVSLRVDLGPMADYFASIMKAAQDQEAEATHLPIGFPAAAKLEEAGITAVADVPRKSSTLRRLGLDGDEVTAVLMEISKESAPL